MTKILLMMPRSHNILVDNHGILDHNYNLVSICDNKQKKTIEMSIQILLRWYAHHKNYFIHTNCGKDSHPVIYRQFYMDSNIDQLISRPNNVEDVIVGVNGPRQA